jgi:SM-20-related protein
MAAEVASRIHGSEPAQCPHLVFRNVLGTKRVAGLLAHVTERETEFRPGVVRDRNSGKRRIDRNLRDCAYLGDLGPFAAPLKAVLEGIAATALADLHLIEPRVAPREFEICAYRDGGHFGPHIDTWETQDRVRIVSCVYYFAATPRRFGGGTLRLYGLPRLTGSEMASPSIDLMPETDTLVVFPSWLRHEVLPVRVPSRAWADGRFAINCWLHRASARSH